MTQSCLLTFRSVTAAMNALQRLRRAFFSAELRRAPRMGNSGGCGYALRLSEKDAADALAILRREGYSFGKLLRRNERGAWTEV